MPKGKSLSGTGSRPTGVKRRRIQSQKSNDVPIQTDPLIAESSQMAADSGRNTNGIPNSAHLSIPVRGQVESSNSRGLFVYQPCVKLECYLQSETISKAIRKAIIKATSKAKITMNDPRILDMCFIGTESNLCVFFIDADNNYILKWQIKGNVIQDDNTNPPTFNVPQNKDKNKNNMNRLSKINDNLVAIVYKKQFYIVLFDVNEMKIQNIYQIDEEKFEYKEYGIQGLACISRSDSDEYALILSNKSSLYRTVINPEAYNNKTKQTIKVSVERFPDLSFDTARRFAVSDDRSTLFVADEDDKQITSLYTESVSFKSNQESHNRGLQNVRCIAVTEKKLYAATSAGISVYSHEEGFFSEGDRAYKLLITYNEHVEHTRCLCLQKFENRIYLALSFVKRGKDEIAVFSFKETDDYCF